MTTKEIKAKIVELLSTGASKMDVFTKLSGQGITDNRLAYFIASYADPVRCREHKSKVNIIIVIMVLLAITGLFFAIGAAAKFGPIAKLIFGGLVLLIQSLFIWGFYTNRVAAYNVYILLTIIQLPKSIIGLVSSSSIVSIIGIAINIGIIVYIWYVRSKIFPDFVFTNPKKINGQYV